MFVAESTTYALAAFRATTGIVHATMLCKTSTANAEAATIADIPHPFYWILFATAVAGNHNVCHIFFVYSVNGVF